jgi:hypothetical protein
MVKVAKDPDLRQGRFRVASTLSPKLVTHRCLAEHVGVPP